MATYLCFNVRLVAYLFVMRVAPADVCCATGEYGQDAMNVSRFDDTCGQSVLRAV